MILLSLPPKHLGLQFPITFFWGGEVDFNVQTTITQLLFKVIGIWYLGPGPKIQRGEKCVSGKL
jgi:hypothetical protein